MQSLNKRTALITVLQKSTECSHTELLHSDFGVLVVRQAMERIAREEDAKLFVPVSIAQYSVYEAIAAERLAQTLGVRSCTASAEAVALLNDKIRFTHLCQRIGAPVPQMFPVTSADQLLDLNSRHALPPGLS